MPIAAAFYDDYDVVVKLHHYSQRSASHLTCLHIKSCRWPIYMAVISLENVTPRHELAVIQTSSWIFLLKFFMRNVSVE